MVVLRRTGGVDGVGLLGDAPMAHEYREMRSFRHNLDAARLAFERDQARRVESIRPKGFVDSIAEPSSQESHRRTGPERLNTIRETLNSFGLERSDMQKRFHEDMIGACARLIFKDDLESHIDDLLLELGIDELRSEFMAITPRRFGKTYSVAMFVVAMLMGVEGLEQAIFSTGRRASQKLLELVYRFMCKIPGLKESIIKHNVETIWVRGPNGDQDIRKVFSYPSNVRISSLLPFGIPSFLFCLYVLDGMVVFFVWIVFIFYLHITGLYTPSPPPQTLTRLVRNTSLCVHLSGNDNV